MGPRTEKLALQKQEQSIFNQIPISKPDEDNIGSNV
jgi:hypothetical protein